MYEQRPNRSISLLRGMLTPKAPRRRAPAVFDKKLFVGTEGKYYSLFKLWAYAPSPEFPDLSLFLSLGNSSGNAFSRVTLADLEALTALLQDAVPALKVLFTNYSPQIEILRSSRQATDQAFQAARSANPLGQAVNLNADALKALEIIQALEEKGITFGDDDFSPDDEGEPINERHL